MQCHPHVKPGDVFEQDICYTVNGRFFFQETSLICKFTFSKQCQKCSQEKEMAQLQLEQEIENACKKHNESFWNAAMILLP